MSLRVYGIYLYMNIWMFSFYRLFITISKFNGVALGSRTNAAQVLFPSFLPSHFTKLCVCTYVNVQCKYADFFCISFSRIFLQTPLSLLPHHSCHTFVSIFYVPWGLHFVCCFLALFYIIMNLHIILSFTYFPTEAKH